MLATIDLFIVNIAFPTLQRSFHGTHLSTLSWVLNGYTIVFAALLVPAGRLADRYSLKRSFLGGIAVFTLGSALCAAANGVAFLIAARVVQAGGAAVMIPCSLGLLLTAYPLERRVGAVRTWAGMAGLSAAFGPVLGGLLLTVDWRWIFLVNVPIGVATLVAGSRWLPAPPPHKDPLPDLAGALVLMVAVGLLTLGLVKAPEWGWGSADTLGCLIASACSSPFSLHAQPDIQARSLSTASCECARLLCRRSQSCSSRRALPRCSSQSSCGRRPFGAGRHCAPVSRSHLAH
jgi:MFS family permease